MFRRSSRTSRTSKTGRQDGPGGPEQAVLTRRVTRDRVHEVFGPNVSPAITVSRGETIVVETQDCYRGHLTEEPRTHGEVDRSGSIPVTGPIYVEDASIGDVLSIQVKEIATAGTGVFAVRPETGVPGQDIQKPQVRVLEVNENQVHLDDRLKLPVRPVIGSMGVAAKHGEIDTVYPGRHGGNMDTLEITTGSRIYLPVQVNGALLSLGDVKACVGDGQIAGSGVEIEAEVTLRVDTLPGGRFSWPRVESKGEWITITSASTVDQAARLAIAEMVKWITQDKGLDSETAYALVSLGGSLRVSQWGNPLTTARMVFPKRLINKLKSMPAASGRLNYRVLPPAANGDAGDETVAAEAGQPASRSSRRSGSGRSQRGSGRSRQAGGRRGTRQKSNGAPSAAEGAPTAANETQSATSDAPSPASETPSAVDGAPSPASGENGSQDTQQQQEAASPQDTANVDAGEKDTQQQQEAASPQDTQQQQEAASQQDTANVDGGEKDKRTAAKRGGQGNRTGRGGRRRRPASKKDAAPDQADASAAKPETAREPRAESVTADTPAPADNDREKTPEPAVEAGKSAPETAAQPETDRKPTFGRRQRTVRRA